MHASSIPVFPLPGAHVMTRNLNVGLNAASFCADWPTHSDDYTDNMLHCKMFRRRHEQSTVHCPHITVANEQVIEVNLCTCFKLLAGWLATA